MNRRRVTGRERVFLFLSQHVTPKYCFTLSSYCSSTTKLLRPSFVLSSSSLTHYEFAVGSLWPNFLKVDAYPSISIVRSSSSFPSSVVTGPSAGGEFPKRTGDGTLFQGINDDMDVASGAVASAFSAF